MIPHSDLNKYKIKQHVVGCPAWVYPNEVRPMPSTIIVYNLRVVSVEDKGEEYTRTRDLQVSHQTAGAKTVSVICQFV